MRFFIFLILLCSFPLWAEGLNLKIEDVVEKVSKDNFLVLENAERVYQGKENIKFSRASLLPRLNIWNLLKIPAILVDPMGFGDIIQDIAPFLIPGNWFKLGQARHLYKAQKEQYRALWANEVNTAKLLFMSVYRDQKLAELIDVKTKKYKEILEIARTRNIFGQGNSFALNLIKDRYLALNEDTRNLDNLIYTETKELQYITGINNEQDIKLGSPMLPKLDQAKQIDSSKIIFKAIDASPEIFQYEHLLNALSKVKGEIKFSILGASSYSSGGGVFDHIPIQDGLGFGMGASVRIAKAEGRILKTQLKATIETLKKLTNILVNEYNSLIENYKITRERNTLATANYQAMISHIAIGGALDVLEMIEILDNLYASKILIISYKFRFSDLTEKLMRITFSGDYSDGPSLVAGKNKNKVSKKEIKYFKKYLVSTVAAKEKFLATFGYDFFDTNSLSNLKSYTDSLNSLSKSFSKLVSRAKSLKKVKKYLVNLDDNKDFCQKIILSKVEINNMQDQCYISSLNTCPISYGHYQKNSAAIINNIKKVMSSNTSLVQQCNTYINGEN